MTILQRGRSLRVALLLYSRSSTPWLSDDMAHALAAMCPPLETADVLQAADRLTAGTKAVEVLDQLLRQGADLMTVRRVVEALHALRDARVTDSSLAAWLLARESDGAIDPPDLVAATQRVCQKLAPRLSQLVSPVGTQALLTRSLHVARAKFPFLDGARVAALPEVCLLGLTERMDNLDAGVAINGLQAVLGILLDLLVAFIGEDLTLSLVRKVWPDLPVANAGP